ncbi:MAG: hypothetical protein Q9227_001705 [Pyrenula ochraceoflavens]
MPKRKRSEEHERKRKSAKARKIASDLLEPQNATTILVNQERDPNVPSQKAENSPHLPSKNPHLSGKLPNDLSDATKAKSNKKKKQEKPAEKPAPSTQLSPRLLPILAVEEQQEQEPLPDTDPSHATQPSKPSRFILFIGNLPYTTTTSQLQSHFSSLSPVSIRHATSRPSPTNSTSSSAPERSRGFAFLELPSYGLLKTCLKLFHHSDFQGRRINVELTAGGGGGKSVARRDKLKQKNEKLAEERRKAGKQREKQREKKKREGGGTGANGIAVGNAKGYERSEEANGRGEEGANEHMDVHPSRRARIQTK